MPHQQYHYYIVIASLMAQNQHAPSCSIMRYASLAAAAAASCHGRRCCVGIITHAHLHIEVVVGELQLREGVAAAAVARQVRVVVVLVRVLGAAHEQHVLQVMAQALQQQQQQQRLARVPWGKFDLSEGVVNTSVVEVGG